MCFAWNEVVFRYLDTFFCFFCVFYAQFMCKKWFWIKFGELLMCECDFEIWFSKNLWWCFQFFIRFRNAGYITKCLTISSMMTVKNNASIQIEANRNSSIFFYSKAVKLYPNSKFKWSDVFSMKYDWLLTGVQFI